MADEAATGVSGCSTDSSVRLIKSIEQDFNVDLFDRQTLAFILKERVQLFHLDQLNYAIENDLISPDTLYFDNTVQTKQELINHWLVPIKDTWLAKRFAFASWLVSSILPSCHRTFFSIFAVPNRFEWLRWHQIKCMLRANKKRYSFRRWIIQIHFLKNSI